MKKNIVIVEDFNTSRQIIKKTLEKEGYVIHEAADGREALRFFDGSPVDLVVSDYNMPHMNGGELAEYIRSKDVYKYIPILMLSTETDSEKQKRATSAKITAWVPKPFEVAHFLKIVEKALQK
jgi:two-component system, chemotaxis family, chemotaxis protein CheY